VKKRVLHLVGSFHQGGTERQAVALVRSLVADATFEIYVATLNKEGVLLDEIEKLNLSEILEYKLTSFYNANFVNQVRSCFSYLRKNKIDIIHTHDFYSNVFGMAAATLARVPVKIASKRETGGMRSRSQEFVERIAFSRADRIVANSNAGRRYLIGRDVSPNKIQVIYNGLDLSWFENPSETPAPSLPGLSLPSAENAKIVTVVANLRHPVKNIPMLLRAAKQVVENVANAHFMIAGEGEMENELKNLASELGVAKDVHFIGRCTDVPALLAASDICVLTSTNEGFSNSILEYMAAGKPVVATNVGGAAEAIIDGETGYLVASDDDVALAAKLIELLGEREKADTMGLRGKEVAKGKFSLGSQLSKTLELYHNCLSK